MSSSLPARRVWALGLFGALATVYLVRFVDHYYGPAPGAERAWVPQYQIDEIHYLRGGRYMVHRGHGIFTRNVSNSVAMQWVASHFVRWSRNPRQGLLHFNQVLFVGTALLLGGVLTWTAGPLWGLLASILVIESTDLLQFSFLIQYEVMAAFLVTAIVTLQWVSGRWSALLAGLLMAFLCFVRAHFILLFLFLFGVGLIFPAPDKMRRLGWVVAGFLIISVPVNLYYSGHLQRPFLFQRSVQAGVLARNVGEGSGEVFPKQPKPGPSGAAFIRQRPKRYLRLLVRRFSVLFGIQNHYWYEDSRWVRAIHRITGLPFSVTRGLFVGLCGLSLGFGLWGLWCRGMPLEELKRYLSLILPVGVIVTTALVVDMASRFLIPFLPCLIAAHCLAVREGWLMVKRRLYRSWENNFQHLIQRGRTCSREIHA